MYPDFFLSVQQEPNEIMKWEYHRIAGFKGLKLKTLIALISQLFFLVLQVSCIGRRIKYM